jgi:iron(III) transport system permease protein
VALVAMERFARRKQRYATDARRARGLVPQKVGLIKGILLFLAGAMPVLIGFAAPAIYLVVEAWKRYQFAGLSSRVVSEAVSTVTIATLATVVTVGFGLAVAYSNRIRSGRLSAALLRISTIGYAAPGTVVAIGVLIMLAGLDRFIDRTALDWFGVSTGLLFMGSGAALIYALTTRFLAISAGGVEAGLARVPLSLDHASRTLGQSTLGTFRHVHLPLSKTAISAAALLVFVDCVKELPATLLLRPLNVETFATHLYGEAARGTYEEASIAALAIVAVSILPVILLSRVGRNEPQASR